MTWGSSTVLVGALVAVTLVGLRVGLGPGTDFVFVDTNLAVFEPGVKFRQRLAVVVFTDAGIHAVIPLVDPANQVITRDIAVGHQGAAVRATSVKHADPVVETNDHKVDTGD